MLCYHVYICPWQANPLPQAQCCLEYARLGLPHSSYQHWQATQGHLGFLNPLPWEKALLGIGLKGVSCLFLVNLRWKWCLPSPSPLPSTYTVPQVSHRGWETKLKDTNVTLGSRLGRGYVKLWCKLLTCSLKAGGLCLKQYQTFKKWGFQAGVVPLMASM